MEDTNEIIRTGTLWTAATHVITTVVGTGVLALPWSVAQLGWILGPLALIAFAVITYYSATVLCDCSIILNRNNDAQYTYLEVVKYSLGYKSVIVCGVCQFAMLWGNMIGCVIVTVSSLMAVSRSSCFHSEGYNASCTTSAFTYMIIFGVVEAILSQCPNLEKAIIVSVIAAVMSFVYSIIASALTIRNFLVHPSFHGTLLGVHNRSIVNAPDLTKVWHSFQALGNIVFAYNCSLILVEIQGTLKTPPSENQTMKKALLYGLGVPTLFNVSLGCIGYAVFGNGVPGNVLIAFSKPIWLVDIANVAVLVHLVGAYQVFAQPIYAKYENYLANKFPDTMLFHKNYRIPIFPGHSFKFTVSKLLFRTLFVAITTIVGMVIPFFNAVLGLLGSIAFWPLTVYIPVKLRIKQGDIRRGERRWVALQCLNVFALLISVLSGIGSIVDITSRLKHFELFKIDF